MQWSGCHDNASHENHQTIAFVLYPGLTPLDLVGPLQVFTSLQKFAPQFRAVVVAERLDPVASDIDVPMLAERTFADVPHPDVIFVPGGAAGTLRAMSDEAVRSYVRTAAESARYVASVCTGSLILASVGLLENRPATTHWVARGVLEQLRGVLPAEAVGRYRQGDHGGRGFGRHRHGALPGGEADQPGNGPAGTARY